MSESLESVYLNKSSGSNFISTIYYYLSKEILHNVANFPFQGVENPLLGRPNVQMYTCTLKSNKCMAYQAYKFGHLYKGYIVP